MCFKGSDVYPAKKTGTEAEQPITIDRAAFDRLAISLRNNETDPSAVLSVLGIAESSIIRIRQSLTGFLEQCKDGDENPTECFISLLEDYMLRLGYLKDDKATKPKPRKEGESLEDQLEKARKSGNKDRIIEIALLLIEDQRETIKLLKRKECLA